MQNESRESHRELSDAYQRARARGQEVGERARTASGLNDGLAPADSAHEDVSPYEKIFTGSDTAIPKPAPLKLNTARFIFLGMWMWVAALVVTLLVPNLHEGGRSWWPWTCVAGMVLGLLGYIYVRRGRGNAEVA